MLGQAWLTARAITGGLLVAGTLLVGAGINMFWFRVFLHAPFGARRGYYQWERSLIVSGFLAVGLGLAGLSSALRGVGDSLFSDLGLTAYLVGVVFLALTEVAWLTEAALPDRLTGALIRLAVVVVFLSHMLYGASLLQTGLLPGWLGWTTVIWNVGWLLALVRTRDPYYPVLHLELPLLAGILLLARA